jgi:hypothetical protein
MPKNIGKTALILLGKLVQDLALAAGDSGGSGSGLFDLASDPGEKRDLSAEKPDILAMVKGRWAAWRKEMDEAEPRGPFRDY